MKKAILLSALLPCLLVTVLHAQPPCGFDIMHNRLLATDPVYARNIKANEEAVQNYIAKHPELKQPIIRGAND